MSIFSSITRPEIYKGRYRIVDHLDPAIDCYVPDLQYRRDKHGPIQKVKVGCLIRLADTTGRVETPWWPVDEESCIAEWIGILCPSISEKHLEEDLAALKKMCGIV